MKNPKRFSGVYRGPEASAKEKKDAAESRIRLAHAVELGAKALAATTARAARRNPAKAPQAATPAPSILDRWAKLSGNARLAFYTKHQAEIWSLMKVRVSVTVRPQKKNVTANPAKV